MKRGFSLIVLIVVVTVLIVITAATTIGVSNAQRNVKVLNFATELSIIQDKVDLYYMENSTYPLTESGASVNLNVSGNSSQYQGESIQNGNIVTLYYLDLEKIYNSTGNVTDEINSLNYGLQEDENDAYLISTTTGRVYYKAGVYDYYTLTDELKQKIGYVESNKGKNINVSGIIFEKDKESYTNVPIVTTIKVPVAYQNIVCKVYSTTLSGTEISGSVVEGNYKKYTTPNNINSNYSLVVTCTSDGESIVATYNVDNFDNTNPVVRIVGSNKKVTNNITGEEENFYYIKYYDNESGMQDIKYVELKIDGNINVISEYMKLYGKSIEGSIVKFLNGTRWLTVYAKDVAGNEVYLYKSVPTE